MSNALNNCQQNFNINYFICYRIFVTWLERKLIIQKEDGSKK